MNPTDRSRPTPSAGRERPKILVIDDETLVRQSFRDYLEDLDYQVIEAENGRLGLDLFFREHPDLVLVDLRMPLVDGIEVLHQVKSRVPATPVIVVSGTGVIADAVEALHLGADDYLLKPLEDLSILRHTIEGALDRARLVRENQAYQTQLEQLVRARTEQLEQANRQLSRINQRLRLIVESTQKLSICRDVRTFGAQLLREFARNMRAAGGQPVPGPGNRTGTGGYPGQRPRSRFSALSAEAGVRVPTRSERAVSGADPGPGGASRARIERLDRVSERVAAGVSPDRRKRGGACGFISAQSHRSAVRRAGPGTRQYPRFLQL